MNYKDAQSRMDIHHHEMRELNKDVRYVINYVKDKYNLGLISVGLSNSLSKHLSCSACAISINLALVSLSLIVTLSASL